MRLNELMFDKAARSQGMTDQEISAFVKTLKKLSTSKRFYRRYYSLGMIHHDNFHDVHTAGQFLAFVRMYMLAFENLLCHVNPNVVIPYWDVGCWSSNPFEAPLWRDNFLGGNGHPDDNFCVTNGPFSFDRWLLPNKQCLKRHMKCPFPPQEAVQWAMECKDINCFDSRLRVTLHDQIFAAIGGTIMHGQRILQFFTRVDVLTCLH